MLRVALRVKTWCHDDSQNMVASENSRVLFDRSRDGVLASTAWVAVLPHLICGRADR